MTQALAGIVYFMMMLGFGAMFEGSIPFALVSAGVSGTLGALYIIDDN